MSTTYTGVPGNATPGVVPVVTVPLDGDSESAASVTSPGPFHALTDQIAGLLTQAFLPGQKASNYASVNLSTTNAGTTIAVQLLSSHIVGAGNAGNIRIYLVPGGIVFTVNAYVDSGHSSWTADDINVPSMAMRLGADANGAGSSPTFSIDTALANNLVSPAVANHWFDNYVTSGTNSGWTSRGFDLNDPTNGGNYYYDALSAGLKYLNIYNGAASVVGLQVQSTNLDEKTAFITTPVPTNGLRRLVSQHACRGGILTRVYAENANYADIDGWGMEVVTNASWNGTMWVKDTASVECSRYCFGGNGYTQMNVPGSQASPFSDATWNVNAQMTGGTLTIASVFSTTLNVSGAATVGTLSATTASATNLTGTNLTAGAATLGSVAKLNGNFTAGPSGVSGILASSPAQTVAASGATPTPWLVSPASGNAYNNASLVRFSVSASVAGGVPTTPPSVNVLVSSVGLTGQIPMTMMATGSGFTYYTFDGIFEKAASYQASAVGFAGSAACNFAGTIEFLN